jgi:hypothetical protein
MRKLTRADIAIAMYRSQKTTKIYKLLWMVWFAMRGAGK